MGVKLCLCTIKDNIILLGNIRVSPSNFTCGNKSFEDYK